MRAVIMAAGEGTRWGSHRGVPKHLVDVDGEPLLVRTVRQLTTRDAEVIILGPPDRRYQVSGAWTVPPPFVECDTDKFLSTVPWWDPTGPTMIVYGDAYLTDPTVDRIVTARGMVWVGREGPSSWTGCDWGELFAVTVTPDQHGRLAGAVIQVRGLLLAGLIGRGGGWEVYRATQGLDLGQHEVAGDFLNVDDWSEDFDWPDDYERWLTRRAEVAVCG